MFCLQVVQYIGYVDCEDNENGHGTHVGGSAAGAVSNGSPGDHFGDGVSGSGCFAFNTAAGGRGRQGRVFKTISFIQIATFDRAIVRDRGSELIRKESGLLNLGLFDNHRVLKLATPHRRAPCVQHHRLCPVHHHRRLYYVEASVRKHDTRPGFNRKNVYQCFLEKPKLRLLLVIQHSSTLGNFGNLCPSNKQVHNPAGRF